MSILRIVACTLLLALAAGCASPPGSVLPSNGSSPLVRPVGPSTEGCNYVRWARKLPLHLRHSQGKSRNLYLCNSEYCPLYFCLAPPPPVSCEHGSKVYENPYGFAGDPGGPEVYTFYFAAKNRRRDHCTFTVTLSGSGSRPSATMNIDVLP